MVVARFGSSKVALKGLYVVLIHSVAKLIAESECAISLVAAHLYCATSKLYGLVVIDLNTPAVVVAESQIVNSDTVASICRL